MVTSMNYDAYLPGFLINDPKFESVVDIMLIIGHNHLRGLKNVEKKKKSRLTSTGGKGKISPLCQRVGPEKRQLRMQRRRSKELAHARKQL